MNLIEKYVLPGKKMALFFYIRGALHNLVPMAYASAPFLAQCQSQKGVA